MLDGARKALARFVGAKAENLVFVANATSGVNTVLRSLRFAPGDELLVTDHEYNACRNALQFAAERDGAKVVVVRLPFPFQGAEQIMRAIHGRVTRRTRLALIDHVTSQTGLVLPIVALVRELAERGVDTLVDGAHGPGMVPLELEKLGGLLQRQLPQMALRPEAAAFLHVHPGRAIHSSAHHQPRLEFAAKGPAPAPDRVWLARARTLAPA